MHKLLVRSAWWLAGAALAAAGCVAIARMELAHQRELFETDARIVHRLLSQRAVQHDAVLATLALLQPGASRAAAAATPADAAGAEQRLPAVYPQVLAVRRRDAGGAWPAEPLAGGHAGAADARLAQAEAESRKANRPALAWADLAGGRYALVLAGDPASYALTLDLRRTVPWNEWPMAVDTSPVRVTLEHAGQSFVVQRGEPARDGWPLDFRKHLAADSQPFDVVATRTIGWGELPWLRMLAWTAAVAALLASSAAWLRQREARRRAEELLRLGQVARLNALGELAAGMAHELNQPLTAVLAGTQAARRVLVEDPPDLPAAREALEHAAGQARRASDVLTRLRRSVERPDAGRDLQPVDLHEAARGALDLLQPECARRGVAPRLEGAAPTTVRAEPVALEQVVHNLLLNALQALEQVPQHERELKVTVAAQGATGVLEVADSGPGIPADVLPRIFEPFFTTRREGLGLGLSLSESLASGMGGELAARPREPRGAVLRLALPLAGASPA
ncbi:sensor histidine kinase [Ramlibacter albus]|uniref:histidine kinase n=1 Tax=Ramlibacter albus TaxID=2079448 RepID=A0A923S1Y0_9BURK|nr:ATP-binding protein [Ramlibacter albus]MBC5764899.1 two-component sensor histidine kinase [Ramlibacter albus]